MYFDHIVCAESGKQNSWIFCFLPVSDCARLLTSTSTVSESPAISLTHFSSSPQSPDRHKSKLFRVQSGSSRPRSLSYFYEIFISKIEYFNTHFFGEFYTTCAFLSILINDELSIRTFSFSLRYSYTSLNCQGKYLIFYIDFH